MWKRYFDRMTFRRYWRRINNVVATVERVHQRWLADQAGRKPHSSINSARVGGELAREALKSLPRDCDPAEWLHRAVVKIDAATEAFAQSDCNDEYNYGRASVGRIGHALSDLYTELYGRAIETRYNADELGDALHRQFEVEADHY